MDHCRRFQHNMSRKWNHQRSLARSLMHRHVVPLSTKSDTQTHTHIYSENKLMQHLRHIHTHTISHDVPLNTFCMFLTHSCVWIKPWSGHGAGEGEVETKAWRRDRMWDLKVKLIFFSSVLFFGRKWEYPRIQPPGMFPPGQHRLKEENRGVSQENEVFSKGQDPPPPPPPPLLHTFNCGSVPNVSHSSSSAALTPIFFKFSMTGKKRLRQRLLTDSFPVSEKQK